jgi:hypothetical protein
MARSYKAPYATDNGPDRKRRKRKANKAVRRAEDIADGKAYRKVSESWDICDFSFEDNSPKGRRK